MAESSGLVVMVCTGNICRSPMAAALLAHALAAEESPLSALKVVSAGVAAPAGDPASLHSVTVLRRVGLDIADHLSQPLSPELVEAASAIFVMTETHRAIIHALFDPAPDDIFLLREFMPSAAAREIDDPYGGSLACYEGCRDEIVESIPSLVAFLREKFS